MHSSIGIGLLTLLCALPLSSRPASAQPPPPIQGVTGTIATDGTIESEHRAAHAIAEGAAHVVDSAKKILPGGKGTKQNPLDDFTEGSRVILRDVVKVDGESQTTTEGVVVDVNHRKNQITVRLADKKTETLRVVTPDTTADVVVSYTDNTGARIAHDFKRVS
jgi:S1-C subfamily serine protease